MKEIEVVILTKSIKNRGYCVAGINIADGKWVRFVSEDDDSQGALFDADMKTKDGYCCDVLDLVGVQIVDKRPIAHQPENVLINADCHWEKVGTKSISEVLAVHPLEKHTYLLGNEWHYITEVRVNAVGHSLSIIEVSDLVLSNIGNKTKACFKYNGCVYNKMSVTDPVFYNKSASISKAILVVSLPKTPYDGKYFKFIAKIFN